MQHTVKEILASDLSSTRDVEKYDNQTGGCSAVVMELDELIKNWNSEYKSSLFCDTVELEYITSNPGAQDCSITEIDGIKYFIQYAQ